jgi:hypothetical protein
MQARDKKKKALNEVKQCFYPLHVEKKGCLIPHSPLSKPSKNKALLGFFLPQTFLEKRLFLTRKRVKMAKCVQIVCATRSIPKQRNISEIYDLIKSIYYI